jgi:hypothetical protein
MTAASMRGMLKCAINPGMHVRKIPCGRFVALHEYQSWVPTICVVVSNLHTNEKIPQKGLEVIDQVHLQDVCGIAYVRFECRWFTTQIYGTFQLVKDRQRHSKSPMNDSQGYRHFTFDICSHIDVPDEHHVI